MPQYTRTALEEQLGRSERLPVGWPWRLLIFTFIIFGLTVVTYLGMSFGYKPYLNSRIKNLDAEIANLSQSVDEQQQKNLASFYSSLVNIQNLLASHPVASKFFDFLEKNTHQKIYYLSLNLSLLEKNIRLDGVAPDYDAIAQQLELFRKAPEIERIFLDDSRALDTGGIRFSIRFVFKPALMSQNQTNQ